MKILVIDDSSIHQAAAKRQLTDHDLTVVGTYDEAQALLGYNKWNDRSDRHDFEVVLCDLLMPASGQMQASFELVGKEMPVGIFLAILAAKNGAKHVAILTDCNHHSHPASACFDAFNKDTCAPTVFTVEGARVMLCNQSGLVQDDESVQPVEVEHTRVDGTKWVEKQYPRIKRWDWLLRNLLIPTMASEEEGGIA